MRTRRPRSQLARDVRGPSFQLRSAVPACQRRPRSQLARDVRGPSLQLVGLLGARGKGDDSGSSVAKFSFPFRE
jgi:hypothetical protein